MVGVNESSGSKVPETSLMDKSDLDWCFVAGEDPQVHTGKIVEKERLQIVDTG